MAASRNIIANPGASNETPDPAAAGLRLRRLRLIEDKWVEIHEDDPRYNPAS